MSYQHRSRPAGYSDEDSEDDDESMDFCGGVDNGNSQAGNQTNASRDAAQPPLANHQQIASATSSCGSPPWGATSGRGRGRGISPVFQAREVGSDPPRNWIGGGRGRGISSTSSAAGAYTSCSPSSAHRHRRRSGSSSPTSGADKRKLKEALLKRVPNFGNVLQQEVWAREISKNLKVVWESDQKCMKPTDRKFGKELQKVFQYCREEKRWSVPSLALFLVINSSDFLAPQGGKNQAQAVCNGLAQCIRSSAALPTDPHLSFSGPLQQVAFEAAVFQRKESLLKLILESFQLTAVISVDMKPYLLNEIQQLVLAKDYTEACFCANHLNLHSSFDIHAFLVPLILQDRPAVVEDFLEGSPEHQRQLIKFLDEQFQHGNNMVFGQLVRYKSEHRIPDTKDDKLNHKPISKLIKRLRTKYNLGFDCCPNIGHRQRFGELRHLFARRYEKNEMSAESFTELIDQLSQDSETLKEDIITHYLDYQDFLGAARFIISHELFSSPACQNHMILRYLPEPWKSDWEAKLRRNPEEDECWDEGWEESVNKAVSELHQTTREKELQEQNWEDDMPTEDFQYKKRIKMKSYFCHPFPRSSLHILEDPHQILALCATIAQAEKVTVNAPVISGFDSEWKPIMSRTSGAALLQLAFEDSVHLVDLVGLKEYLKKEGSAYQGPCVWKALRRDYFENEHLLKLGFDLRNDVKMLTETVPQWKGMNLTWRRMLDLSSLKSLILKECPHLFTKGDGGTSGGAVGGANGEGGGESGLSELVFLCTGQSLSKEEQMSDWEKRPLREPQVLYAASDAYCLISIYKSLEKLCKKKEVNLERIMKNYFKGCSTDGNGGGVNGGGDSSRKKRSSVEIVLDLLPRLPSLPGGGGKGNTGCVKLVVDTMLLGLGRYLRCLGFDTVLLGNNEGHECCINYVRRDGRRIITRGLQAYRKIQYTLDGPGEEEMMYLVKSESTAAQLEEICNHFNVALSHSRLFTICHRCNTSEFIQASPGLMYSLMEIAGCHLLKPPTTAQGDLAESLQLFKSRSLDDMILLKQLGEEDSPLKTWTLLEEDTLQISDGARTVLTPRGEKVELTRLQMVSHLLDHVFICNGCGKCYWSSRHLEEVLRENGPPQ